MSRSRFSLKSQDSNRSVADLTHPWSDSEPGVNTVGIDMKIIRVDVKHSQFDTFDFEILVKRGLCACVDANMREIVHVRMCACVHVCMRACVHV